MQSMRRCPATRKRIYYSKAKARQAARRQRRYYGRRYWYLCPFCGHYHLTHMEQTAV